MANSKKEHVFKLRTHDVSTRMRTFKFTEDFNIAPYRLDILLYACRRTILGQFSPLSAPEVYTISALNLKDNKLHITVGGYKPDVDRIDVRYREAAQALARGEALVWQEWQEGETRKCQIGQRVFDVQAAPEVRDASDANYPQRFYIDHIKPSDTPLGLHQALLPQLMRVLDSQTPDSETAVNILQPQLLTLIRNALTQSEAELFGAFDALKKTAGDAFNNVTITTTPPYAGCQPLALQPHLKGPAEQLWQTLVDYTPSWQSRAITWLQNTRLAQHFGWRFSWLAPSVTDKLEQRNNLMLALLKEPKGIRSALESMLDSNQAGALTPGFLNGSRLFAATIEAWQGLAAPENIDASTQAAHTAEDVQLAMVEKAYDAELETLRLQQFETAIQKIDEQTAKISGRIEGAEETLGQLDTKTLFGAAKAALATGTDLPEVTSPTQKFDDIKRRYLSEHTDELNYSAELLALEAHLPELTKNEKQVWLKYATLKKAKDPLRQYISRTEQDIQKQRETITTLKETMSSLGALRTELKAARDDSKQMTETQKTQLNDFCETSEGQSQTLRIPSSRDIQSKVTTFMRAVTTAQGALDATAKTLDEAHSQIHHYLDYWLGLINVLTTAPIDALQLSHHLTRLLQTWRGEKGYIPSGEEPTLREGVSTRLKARHTADQSAFENLTGWWLRTNGIKQEDTSENDQAKQVAMKNYQNLTHYPRQADGALIEGETYAAGSVETVTLGGTPLTLVFPSLYNLATYYLGHQCEANNNKGNWHKLDEIPTKASTPLLATEKPQGRKPIPDMTGSLTSRQPGAGETRAKATDDLRDELQKSKSAQRKPKPTRASEPVGEPTPTPSGAGAVHPSPVAKGSRKKRGSGRNRRIAKIGAPAKSAAEVVVRS